MCPALAQNQFAARQCLSVILLFPYLPSFHVFPLPMSSLFPSVPSVSHLMSLSHKRKKKIPGKDKRYNKRQTLLFLLPPPLLLCINIKRFSINTPRLHTKRTSQATSEAVSKKVNSLEPEVVKAVWGVLWRAPGQTLLLWPHSDEVVGKERGTGHFIGRYRALFTGKL